MNNMNNQFQSNAGAEDDPLWDEFCDHVDELVASGKYDSRYQAGLEVRRRFPHLKDVMPRGLSPDGRVASGVSATSSGSGRSASSCAAGYVDAEAELDRRAKKISAERGISFAQAYVQALNADAGLYELYLRQQLARVEKGQRGQQSV